MKKLLSSLLIGILLLLGAGCYSVKAARKSDIVGTYQLVSYSIRGVDEFTEKQMVAYLVLREGDTGYYVYQDVNTELTVREVKVVYEASESNPSKYEYVKFIKDTSSEGDMSSWTKLGYNDGVLNANLTSLEFVDGSIQSYQTTTVYERISKDQDLTEVAKHIENLPGILPYGIGLYDGAYKYSFNYTENVIVQDYIDNYDIPVVYMFMDLNILEMKADFYYMLFADKQQVVVKDLPISFEGDTLTVGDMQMTVGANKVIHRCYTYVDIPCTFTYEGNTYTFSYRFDGHSRSTLNIQQDIDIIVSQTFPEEGE